jgi:hypothetical protein
MAFSETIRKLIEDAWDDGYPCLLGSEGENGPNISPKGSMMIFDDDHLAYWERSKRSAFANLQKDPRVVVVYSNMAAQRDKRLESGILRFYGVAEFHEDGPIHDAIFARLPRRGRARQADHVTERARRVSGAPCFLPASPPQAFRLFPARAQRLRPS